MSFWDQVTGGTVPVAPRPQVATQPWFREPLVPVSYQTPGTYPQPVDVPVEDPAVEASRKRAPSSRSNRTCPNCGSGNVCKPSANIMEQCYECGWNPRFDQMAAGIQSSGGEGPAQPSKQVSTANNFNPTTFNPANGGAGRMG